MYEPFITISHEMNRDELDYGEGYNQKEWCKRYWDEGNIVLA